jgi:dihydrofolate reductase
MLSERQWGVPWAGMGRITLMSSISLDGMFEGPGHDISWSRVDEEVHFEINAAVAQAGAVLNGRRTWELMVPFWPEAESMPDATPATIEYSRIFTRTPQYVFSRTLGESEWATEIFTELDPDAIRALAERHGSLVVGAGEIGSQLLRLGLVDELRFYLNPIVLGEGTRALPSDLRLDLELTETRSFGNGVVLVRYDIR